jgi:hypothetical protein
MIAGEFRVQNFAQSGALVQAMNGNAVSRAMLVSK